MADWAADINRLRSVREAVFVLEQSVPVELEWDEFDAVSTHVLAESDGLAIGTGRLLPDGHIGRMAVLKPWRGIGVGNAMLATLVELARARGYSSLRLNAQEHAIAFYQRQGFIAEGDIFDEAGIPHRRMVRDV
ncbi:MAG: GNAT family N-acetyltransferase [Burkholderiales bacterium]